MVNVQIEKDDLLHLLLDRVDFWTHDPDVKNLYEAYYAYLIVNGCFEGEKLNISIIVDSDYLNNFNVYGSIEEIMKDYNEDEEEARERIVAECNGLYLVSVY